MQLEKGIHLRRFFAISMYGDFLASAFTLQLVFSINLKYGCQNWVYGQISPAVVFLTRYFYLKTLFFWLIGLVKLTSKWQLSVFPLKRLSSGNLNNVLPTCSKESNYFTYIFCTHICCVIISIAITSVKKRSITKNVE